MMSPGGVSDGGYNSMTQEDVRRLSQMMSTEGDSLASSSPSPTTAEPPEAHPHPHPQPSAKVTKSESWNPLRFSFRQKKRHHSEKQSADPDSSQDYRSRVGSIVRKSISSFGDQDGLHMLQGPLLGNSAGLLMVSQSFLENGAYMVSGDLRLEMEQASRRLHKGEGAHGNKPMRSMSLFASWRPKHLMNGGDPKAPSASASMRFSDLAKKEEDDISLSSLQSTEDSQTKSAAAPTMVDSDSSSSSGGKCEVKDSGVGLDEPSLPLPESGLNEEGDHHQEEEGDGDGDVVFVGGGATHRQGVGVEVEERDCGRSRRDQQSDSEAVSDPVPPASHHPQSPSSQSQEGVSAAPSSAQSLPSPSTCNNTDGNSSVNSVPQSTTCMSADAAKNFTGGRKTSSDHGDSASADLPSPTGGVKEQGGVAKAPVKAQHPTWLGEVGKTLSTPAISLLPPQVVPMECRSPVQKQQSLPSRGGGSGGEEPRKSLPGGSNKQQSEYLMRRSHSLKRGSTDMMQRTNEAITGLWKFASKAASVSYSKFNELKQSITTPVKNAASLSSLSHSQDDLDDGGGGSLGGGVGGEEDCASNSSASGTLLERLRGLAGSQDRLSLAESSGTDPSANQRLSQTSFGESCLGSAPSPSYLDSFRPARELRSDSVSAHSTEGVLMTVAMEVEMSTCSRCGRCHRLVYDEEIMSGWSADDSNLNTTCPFCHAKFVPNLQVYVKDWRGHQKSMLLSSGKATSTHGGGASESRPPDESSCPPDPVGVSPTDPALTSPDPAPLTPTQEEENEKEQMEVEVEGKQPAEMVSSMHREDLPLSLPEAAAAMRRRCTSECLTNATDHSGGIGGGYYNCYLGSLEVPRSPLTLSIEEDGEQQSGNTSEASTTATTAGAVNTEMKKDFMTRSQCTAEPLVFPYLSPLVLRKELEYVLDHEGDLCLSTQAFLDQHPIIFWNLVWYFRRLEIPSHLSSFLLTAASFNSPEVCAKGAGPFDSRNILIRPVWDNVRIHDEVGLPMYMAWEAGNKSTVVDALVTESEAFTRPCMFQIISSIQRNDVLTAIKLVALGRRRLMGRRRRFRSLYREILFLSFMACGRENIDHDAFDREFTVAFEEKLSPAEVRRLQTDDRPRSANVQWCRRVFCELDI